MVSEASTNTGKFPVKIFLFAFFGWAFDFYDLVLLGFLKDDVARDLHLSHAAEGWLLGVALGASGVGGIVAGALADRIGKRTMLASTIALYSLGSLVCGLAPNVTVFVLGRMIVGLGVGGEWAIGHGMVAEAVAPKIRARASAALQAGEPVGVAIAAMVGYFVLPHVSWRKILVASSLTALFAFFARRSVHLPNEPAVNKSPEKSQLKQLHDAHIWKVMFLAWVLGVLKLGTYWTCYTWLPSFLMHEMHQTIAKSARWMLSAQAGQLVGMMMFGAVADRIGRRPAFSIFSFITACAIAPLAFAWSDLSQKPGLFWACMLMLGFGSGCTAGFGALLAELFPTEVRGFAMGTTYNMARAAQLLSPVVVGAMVTAYGLSGGLSVPLVLALGTASWVWVLPETRGIKLRSLDDPPDSNGESRRAPALRGS
ncbi:MAG: MFS transporter [Polyangiaceae bacterium]